MATAVGDDALARAIEASFLAPLAPEVREAVVRHGELVHVRAGRLQGRSPAEVTRGGLVVDGVFRAFIMAADGRRLTVRHARPGELVGLSIGASQPAPIFVEAVTDGRLLELSGADLEALAAEHGTLALALAREVGTHLREGIDALAEVSFGTLRARLVRLLFEIAVPTDEAGGLIVPATQQELADSLGTVREVIARLVGQLRDAGLIEVARGVIVIRDGDRLAALAGRWHEGRYWTTGSAQR